MKFKFLIPVVIVVVLIAGGVLGTLYTQVWNPLWNPFSPPRESMVERAFAKMMGLESFRAQGNINFEIKTKDLGEEETEDFKIAVNFSGALDIKNSRSSSDFELTFGGQGLDISFTGELRAIEGDFYFSIKTFPEIPFLFKGLEELKNQWFKLSKEMLMERLKVEGEEAADEEKAKEILQEFINALREKEIIQVKDDFGVEEIDGIKTNHYLVLLKEDELREVILEFLQRIKKYVPEEEMASYEEKLREAMEELPENFEEFFGKVGTITFEVWISRDNQLRRVKGEKEIDLSLFEQFEDSSGNRAKIKISFDFKLSNFNQEIKVEVPEESKSIEEILPPGILGTFSQETPSLIPEEEGSPSFEEFEFGEGELPSPEEMEELERLLEELQKE